MATPKTVSFHTLGCKLNFSETSSIRRQFEKEGYQTVDIEEGADLCVINTCSVTDFADRKCRKFVRNVLRKNADTKICVVGCYAQLKPQEIADIPGVDLVLGAAEKFRILDYVEDLSKMPGKGWVYASDVREANTFVEAFSFGDRTRSFLKVQDGCNYKCSFCTIPQARGKSRSDTIDKVLRNVEQIANQGVQEIVLTGVNLGDFGNGTEVIEGLRPRKEALFIDLMMALEKQGAVPRFRISSIEPNLCTNEIISFVSGSKHFMPHFHMPLQSGNDKQLRMMKRRYTRSLYQSRVEHIKELMPHACIGVDVIVGFPGETQEDFKESKSFIANLPVDYLHVFTYSERPNTVAADMSDLVPVQERRARNEALRLLSIRKKRAFYEQFVGQTRNVLLEKDKAKGVLSGFTDNYLKVLIPDSEGEVNRIINVTLKEITPDGIFIAEKVHGKNHLPKVKSQLQTY